VYAVPRSTGWLARVVHRIEHGEGRMEDLDLLVDMAGKIEGRTICALGDAAAMRWRASSVTSATNSNITSSSVAAGL